MKFFIYVCLTGILSTSVQAEAEAPDANDAAYNQKVFELSAILYGVTEIGAKSCKAAGTKIPGSLTSWNEAVNAYFKGETVRDQTLNNRVAALNKKVEELVAKKDNGMQADNLQVNIESADAAIESIGGASGRIALRQQLLAAIDASLEANEKENAKARAAYSDLNDKSFAIALASAKAGCERKKKVSKCTTTDDVETCVVEEVKDPVPGCEVALEKLPVLKSDTVKKYGDLYLNAQDPSTDLNDKMEKLEKTMKSTMASIPPSSDSNYDWNTDLDNSIAKAETARKDAGIKCPSSKNAAATGVASGSASYLDKIGSSGDSSSVASNFSSSWNIADTVIGQAGQRPAYFNYIAERVNELLAMDQTYLERANSTRAKTAGYMKEVKSALDSGGGGGAGSGGDGTGNKTDPIPTVSASAISANLGGISNSSAAISNALNSAKTLKAPIAENTTSSSVAIENKNSSDKVSLASSLSAAKNAIANSTATAKNASGPTSKTISSAGITATKAGAESSSIKKYASANASSTTATAEKSEYVKSLRAASKSLSEAMNNSFESFKNTPGSSEIYQTAALGSSSRYSENGTDETSRNSPAASALAVKKLSVILPPAAYKAIVPAPRVIKNRDPKLAKTPRKYSADSELLAQIAVDKNLKEKNEYKSNDDDSLFDKVTKAYIRNYDKVSELPEN